MFSLLSVLGFSAVSLLPGAWLTFLLPLRGLKFWLRLLIGAALSPIVVLIQFYILRLSGLSFSTTAMLLPIINAPVLYWMGKYVSLPRWPGWQKALAGALAVLIPVGFLWFQFRDPEVRAYTGHAWLQADIIYAIANGDLMPKDSDVAGLALGYPWGMHVFQAVGSYLFQTPPVNSYHWTNFLMLAVTAGLLVSLVRSLGGGFMAQVVSLPLLFFSVNFVGYMLQHLLPQSFVASYAMWGNYRYTPWIFYFYFFSMVPHALVIFSGLAVLCIQVLRQRLSMDFGATIALLVCSLGVLYALAAPATWMIFGMFALWRIWESRRSTGRLPMAECLFYAGVFLAVGALTVAFQAILAIDRTPGTDVAFSNFRRMVAKSFETGMVFFPVWIALPFLFRELWRTRRAETVVLAGGGLLNCLLYVLFVVNTRTWATVEYKFIMCGAVVLIPFAALLVERIADRRRFSPAAVVLGLTVVLAAPFVHKISVGWPWTIAWNNGMATARGGPALDMGTFDLRLAAADPRAGLYDAVRTMTPVNAMLVVAGTQLQLPTLTRRPLYVPPFEKMGRPGLAGDIDTFLFDIKGYSKDLVAERRETVKAFYDAPEEEAREHALRRILQLHRPLAVIVDEQHANLNKWFAGRARSLYSAEQNTLWLVDPAQQHWPVSAADVSHGR